MHEEWWYSIGDSRKGPFTRAALLQLLLENKITQSTLVWKEGLTSYTPLSELIGLERPVGELSPAIRKSFERERLIVLPLASPWRRFFARYIDFWIIAMPVAGIVAFSLSRLIPAWDQWVQYTIFDYVFIWLLCPFIMLVEAGIFAIFGTTFGKALLGVIVTTTDAQRPTAAQYIRRQLGVYWFGLGTRLPLICLFTMAVQQGLVAAGLPARYDKGKFTVKASKLGVIRGLSVVMVVIGLYYAYSTALQKALVFAIAR